MYFRFGASPHAMPLSLRFQVEGRARLTGQLLWEYWDGKDFEPVRTVDQTERLLHSGEYFLFRRSGCRRRSSSGSPAAGCA